MPPVGGGDPFSIPLEFKIFNEAQTARVETFQVSIPFPEGGYPASQLSSLIVSGFQTAWIPLQYWADGTLKVAQAQFTDTLSAGQRKTYSIARNIPAASGSFVRNNWVNQMISTLEVGAEVRDTFNEIGRAHV